MASDAAAAVRVYLGLGANLGDREASLERAVALLAEGGVTVEARSPIYETDPVGYADQPRFLNAVLQGATRLSPQALLLLCKAVEAELGRQPSFRNAPRIIDVDILLYGDSVLDTPGLTLPHPRLAERAFVLVPLADLAPGLTHPVLGAQAADLAARVEGRQGVHLWKRDWGQSASGP